MTVQQYIIAMDVGGSSVKSGLVDFDLNISHHAHTPIDSQGSAEDNGIFLVFNNYLHHYSTSAEKHGRYCPH